MRDIILLNDVKVDGAKNMPIFKISYIKQNINLDEFDALIFTSKNGISAIDSFNKKWRNMPSYCIAKMTASVVLKMNGKVVFVGERSHGNEFAQELVPLLKNKKALYIRAKKTVSQLATILENNGVDIQELIVYETVCNDEHFDTPSKNSVIIFTSPSSVECFFKRFSWHESYKAIIIGKTTAKYMPNNIDYRISETQSVESCVNLALSL